MERIGIYGGTFNPPHVGHIQAAQAAMDALRLDRLLLIPAFQTPEKAAPEVSGEHRLQMLRLAASSGMEVSDIELARGGVSYTVQTLAQLRQENPHAQLVLCVGSDKFLNLHNWKDPHEICRMAQIAVLYRGDKGEKEKIQEQKKRLEAAGADITIVENPVISISSSNLRRMLAFGCGAEFLPEGVADYIRHNGLYDTRKNWKQLPMEQLEKIVMGLL